MNKKKFRRLPILLMVLKSGIGLSPARAEGNIEERLARIDIQKDENKDYVARIQRDFDLDSPTVRTQLRKVVRSPQLTGVRNGLAMVVLANGTKGCLWALDMLHEDSAAVRFNIIMATKLLRLREALHAYISLLEDKRVAPRKWRVKPPPAPWPKWSERVCDVAASMFLEIVRRTGKLPEELRRIVFTTSDPISKRDGRIQRIEQWWRREGERFIDSHFKSVVECIIERSEGKNDRGAGDPKTIPGTGYSITRRNRD